MFFMSYHWINSKRNSWRSCCPHWVHQILCTVNRVFFDSRLAWPWLKHVSQHVDSWNFKEIRLGLFTWADIWTFRDGNLLQIFLSNPPDSESCFPTNLWSTWSLMLSSLSCTVCRWGRLKIRIYSSLGNSLFKCIEGWRCNELFSSSLPIKVASSEKTSLV